MGGGGGGGGGDAIFLMTLLEKWDTPVQLSVIKCSFDV